jgi:hypothetical protein
MSTVSITFECNGRRHGLLLPCEPGHEAAEIKKLLDPKYREGTAISDMIDYVATGEWPGVVWEIEVDFDRFHWRIPEWNPRLIEAGIKWAHISPDDMKVLPHYRAALVEAIKAGTAEMVT